MLLKALKSRTIWLNLIALFVALLNYALQNQLWPAEYNAFIIPALAILNGILRLDTVAPVGVKLTRDDMQDLKTGAAEIRLAR